MTEESRKNRNGQDRSKAVKSMKIMVAKRFLHRTESCSILFELVVLWEGETAVKAVSVPRKHRVFVESDEVQVMGRDPAGSSRLLVAKAREVLSMVGRYGSLTIQRKTESPNGA